MSILSTPRNTTLENSPYDLAISQNKVSVYIKMSMYTSRFHTNYFPSTFNILSQNIPQVLKTKCFNKNNYSFDREVLNTEIGHLFEHILLQNLCEMKLEKGAKSAVYKGLTQWDWEKDKKGIFHITLYMGSADWEIFPQALRRTEEVVKKILNSPITRVSIN